eukprot:16115-Heterococcus_DN1.PRE.1
MSLSHTCSSRYGARFGFTRHSALAATCCQHLPAPHAVSECIVKCRVVVADFSLKHQALSHTFRSSMHCRKVRSAVPFFTGTACARSCTMIHAYTHNDDDHLYLCSPVLRCSAIVQRCSDKQLAVNVFQLPSNVFVRCDSPATAAAELMKRRRTVQTMFDVLNELVIPLAGLITATVLFFSPLKEMLRISKSRVIGTLNIFPLAMIVPNCLAWM